MELKTHPFSYHILESRIDHLYRSLFRSSNEIYKVVQNEIRLKGIYNPETDSIGSSENKKEFEAFQQLLRNLNNFVYFNSLLLGSYSIFEFAFIEICEFIDENSSPKHEYDRNKRAIIKNCRRYLRDSKLVNVTSTEIDSKYTKLAKIGKLRNLIAHKNGNILKIKTKELEEQENFNLFSSMQELTILQNGQVYINDHHLLKSFNEDSYAFLKLIIKQLKENNCN